MVRERVREKKEDVEGEGVREKRRERKEERERNEELG